MPAKRDFTSHEQYAVFTAHGERCYLCRRPVDLMSMDVDHVLPVQLLSEPVRLAEVLIAFGLPATFDLHSFENWLPACKPCNNRKRARVFEPVPAVLLELNEARRKAPRAAELATQSVTRQASSRQWNTILRALEAGELSAEIQAAIIEVAAELQAAREPEVASEPLRLTPLLTVIREDNQMRVLRGPYGVGVSPAKLDAADRSWRCVACGNSAWNGTRCVACGHMDDD